MSNLFKILYGFTEEITLANIYSYSYFLKEIGCINWPNVSLENSKLL